MIKPTVPTSRLHHFKVERDAWSGAVMRLILPPNASLWWGRSACVSPFLGQRYPLYKAQGAVCRFAMNCQEPFANTLGRVDVLVMLTDDIAIRGSVLTPA